MPKRIRLMGPVFFRLILLCCVCLAIAGLIGPTCGMLALIVGLFAEITMHLNYIARLAQWLEEPELKQIPAAHSSLWNEIFYRVSKSRKALETNTRRLAEREARYRKTLAALPEGIVLVKNDWALSWCNQNAAAIFGIAGEQDSGRHIFAFIHDSHVLNYIKAGHFDEPFIWRQPDSDRVLELRIVVADHKNALIITRDITEQEQLDAMRREFVANVSHELRTPLTVLMGFLGMALEGIDKNNAKATLQVQHMELMHDQASRMQRLINDLLTLSRLETGSSTKAPEAFSLSELVKTITAETSVIASGTHTVTCSVEPVRIVGYSDEIQSAIANLMTNAIRYTPKGGSIHARCSVRDDGTIAVSVTDNGIGIDPKHIPRLTERFYRVDKSRSRDTGGTGLGLAIVKHVLLHHNARMHIQSQLGKGSTFTVIFPASMHAPEL